MAAVDNRTPVRGVVSRRAFLHRLAASAGAGSALIALATACSSPAPTAAPAAAPTTAAPAATSAPKPAAPTTAPAAGATTAPASAPAAAGPVSGAIRIGVVGDGRTLDPADQVNITERHYLPAIFDNLFSIDEKYDLKPGLATSWSVSDDALTWTLKLQQGVKFHDGTDFNADAVKFNFDRLMDKSTDLHHAADLAVVKSVDVVDPSTIKMTLTEPSTPLLSTMTEASGYMSSPAAIKKFGKDYASNPVGTGPFQLVEWQRDNHLTLKKFDGYWRSGLPRSSGLVWQPIPDYAVKLTNLRTGAIEIVDEILAQNVDNVSGDSSLKLYTLKGSRWPMIRLNTVKGPFANLALRKALSTAINRDAIVKAAYFGHAEPAYGPIPRLYGAAYDPAVDQYGYKYDVAQAKQQLAAGGQPNGFSFTMDITTPYARLAELIQASAAAVGIQFQINNLESAAFTDRLRSKAFDAALGSWTPRADVDGVIYQHFHTKGVANWVSYSNPQVDALLDQTRRTPPGQQRADLFHQVQKLIVADAPWVFLIFEELNQAARGALQGYTISPDTLLRMANASVSDRTA